MSADPPRSLRFCFPTTFYPPFHFGGDAIGVQRLARALVRRGHRVTIVHDVDAWKSISARPEPARAEYPDEPEGLEVVGLRSRLGILSPLLTQQFGRPVVHGREIARILSDGRFDVIHYHNVSLVGGPGILALGSAVKLYTAHEHWLVCPTHVLWRHRREPCEERQCLRCQLSYRRPPQLWRGTGLLERGIAHVDLFLAASEFSREKHRLMGFPRDMEVLPYFLPDPLDAKGDLDPDRSADIDSNRSEGKPARSAILRERPHERPYFLFVGRLERIKGLDDVIPVFASVSDADLLVVGDGTHAAALRAIAGAARNVRFLGRVDDELLARCYAHALALIVPSAGYETFGITVIEAFEHALPVVARRIGPLPEMVARSGGGLVFSTPEELAAALQRLARDPAERSRLGRSGRAALLAHWTESAVVPRYLELVRRVAERKGASAIAEALS